jgi:nicotinamide-nucleotide amidase
MNDSLTYLVQRLADTLQAHNMKLVVAESCTGGGIAQTITEMPGSSGWFERGFVSYSNESKMELLNVSAETLNTFGAVSVEAAAEMAQGALQNSHAQISVAVTGIAGPEGGTDDKPVGTVCFAWSSITMGTVTTSTQFQGDRQAVRLQSILMALEGLLDMLEKHK